MPLNRQIHIYSIDTSAFYTNNEKRLHWKLCALRKEKQYFKNQICKFPIYGWKYFEYKKKVKDLNKSIKINKKIILSKLHRAVLYNKLHNKDGKTNIRKLDASKLVDKNVISIFESSLTRLLGIKQNELSMDIIVVKVYYFDILKDLIQNGFYYNGEKYRFFTASAGQIRTKKTVFIKESKWNKLEKTLMCGLTTDIINSKGGVNINKYLAYLSLTNSATDLWSNFDIRKCIVVDDFETMVRDTVDFINDETYEIVRKEMDVPITHTDGCGLISSSISKKNFMVRLPWVKGLLASCNFEEFIRQENLKDPSINHGIVKDIYGDTYDVIKDNIKIIFFKSQFKMNKYYKDWDEYATNFEKYNCQAGICNMEENYIKNAKINYQMIQTLNDMTDSEIMNLTRKSRKKIERMSTTVKSMLEAFGVTKYNHNKTYLQQALSIYPELLNDTYTKDVLRQIKQSLVHGYKSARLEVNGKYTFIIPDTYAVCEHLFLHKQFPDGLLKNGEVSCKIYKNFSKLDCLRSPHLYKEHAVRKNKIDDTTAKWFTTDALYTSCHDLITKVLQNDVDGDKSLVVADPTLVSIAERNMKNIVPLYYEMKKADPVQLNGDQLYAGMNAAYIGGNIGAISNSITKIWNSCNVTDEALKAVKLLCMENNFTIDYAKTLYKPTRPHDVDELIKRYTQVKVPYFFIYAKDKKLSQVSEINDSVINRICKLITDKRFKFALKDFGKLDYKMLVTNPDIKIKQDVIKKYSELNRKYHYQINLKDDKNPNFAHIANQVKKEMNSLGYSESDLTDILVKQLYGIKHSRQKELLWFCYGDYIVKNLKRNIGNKTSVCWHCGKRFEKKYSAQKYCDDCSGYQNIKKKVIHCIDCGKQVVIDAKDNQTTRCKECQHKRDKENQNKRYKKWYDSHRT